MTKAKGKEMELVKKSDYEMVSRGDEVREVILANLGGEGISPFELDRVQIPGSGGTTWTIPTLDGEEETKELDGILIAFQDKRVYWAKSLDESDEMTPPDCFSEDSVHGVGNPGGDCASCPFSQWESDPKGGKGQACQSRRLLFMVREGNVLPIVVNLPPTSLKAVKQFFRRMASYCVAFYSIEVSLTLEKVKNASGIAYSTVKFAKRRDLEPEVIKGVKAYIEDIAPALVRVSIKDEATVTEDWKEGNTRD